MMVFACFQNRLNIIFSFFFNSLFPIVQNSNKQYILNSMPSLCHRNDIDPFRQISHRISTLSFLILYHYLSLSCYYHITLQLSAFMFILLCTNLLIVLPYFWYSCYNFSPITFLILSCISRLTFLSIDITRIIFCQPQGIN